MTINAGHWLSRSFFLYQIAIKGRIMMGMENNTVFNISVCLIGFVVLLVHIINILLKKKKRKDEKALLIFFLFTAFHFALYSAFTLIKTLAAVHSDAFIMGFYTAFYISNNLEVFLFFLYAMAYLSLPKKSKRPFEIINLVLFFALITADIVNIFTHMFFYASNGEYQRAPAMILSQGYQFVMLALVFLQTVLNKRLSIREKLAFAFYCFLPLVAIILQNAFKGYAIAYLSIIVATEILFVFLSVEKNLALAKEEEKNKDAQIRVMLSQIQPHFIYNSLSAISTLIPIHPEKAQKALDDFTEYLRLNLSTLTEQRLIPFEDELRHIKTFVALEELRFPDRIKVEYHLELSDFNVPPLSVQPLVENALKHGVLKKVEGGTVILSAKEEEEGIVIEVKDDGVGFSMDDVDFSANEHFGLQNIQYRIQKMCGGSLTINSHPGEGTKATVFLPK